MFKPCQQVSFTLLLPHLYPSTLCPVLDTTLNMAYFCFHGLFKIGNHTFYFAIAMLPTKHKFSDKDRASKAAKWGLEALEDMFKQKKFQYEAELKAEGLPTILSSLEATMALAEQEEVKLLHKLSLVSVYKLLHPFL